MKKSVLLLLGIASLVKGEGNPNLEPIVDYVVEPRSIVRLDGEWMQYRQKEEYIATTNRAGEARTNYAVEPFDAASVQWGTKQLPNPKDDFFHDRMHYKRTFVLNAEQSKKAVLFKCEVIGNQYEMFVNGQLAAQVPQSLGLTKTHEITPWVQEGTNEIYFVMKRYCGTGWWEDRPDGMAGMGIRTVPYLELRDKLAVDDVQIVTKVEPKKVFTAKVTLRNGYAEAQTVELTPSVEGAWKGKPQTVVVPAGTNVVVDVEQAWEDVELWSPVNPTLYYARMTVTQAGRVVDAVRERFGFRELTTKGIRMYLNGIPFMMRRCGLGMRVGQDDQGVREQIARLRRDGCVGSRIFYPDNMERLARICDEEGHLISTCPQIGWGPAHRTDTFWPLYYDVIREQVEVLRNHPSIIVWGLGNEFGFCYGGGFDKPELAKATIEKQWAAGKLVESLDSTRLWTCYGSAEMGFPAREDEGPMPIASVHYPFGATPDWARYPAVGYWFAQGGGGWQGMVRRKKPHSVSEDLFHGLQDNHAGLAKLGGDKHYTVEGYAATLHEFARYYTEGYYTGQLFGWEPWCFGTGAPTNLLFQNGRGPIHPDYFISSPNFHRNLFAGESEKHTFYVFNQWFTPLQGVTLTREETLDGKRLRVVTKTIDIPAGERYEEELDVVPPAVRKPSLYALTFTLTQSGKELAKRTFSYPTFPRTTTLKIPRGTALVATTNSPLWQSAFPKGKFLSAEEAVRSGAKQIVVEKAMSIADGSVLQAYVRDGGKVLVARSYPGEWSPIPFANKVKMSSRMFRRAEEHMTDAFDASFDAWRMLPTDTTQHKHSDLTVAEWSYAKPKTDSLVLYDVGFSKGLTHATILWSYEGRGGWLLNSTSAARKHECEPAAMALLQSLVNELDGFRTHPLPKKVVALDATTPYTKFLADNGFVLQDGPVAKPKETVLFVDADNKPLDEAATSALFAHTKRGGDVVLFNMAAETNSVLTSALHMGWKTWDSPQQEVPWWKGYFVKCDNGPKFVTRRHNRGVLSGICNDWLFTWKLDEMWCWGRWNLYHEYPLGLDKDLTMVMNGIFEPQPGFKGELLTDEPCIAISPLGKGRILYSTLNMNALLETCGEKFAYLTRAFFNNLGAQTTPVVRNANATFAPVDFRTHMNATLWNNPAYADENGKTVPNAIFGTDFDLRFFPVNNCGWSLQAGNYCPVDPFPTEPVVLDDIPFQIVNPDKNDRKAVLVLAGTGTEVTIPLPPGTHAKRIHFLGGRHHGCKDFTVTLNAQPAIHFQNSEKEDFPHPQRLDQELGEKVRTACRIPDAKGREFRLLRWWVENPEPNTPLESITLRVESGSMHIIAITLEEGE